MSVPGLNQHNSKSRVSDVQAAALCQLPALLGVLRGGVFSRTDFYGQSALVFNLDNDSMELWCVGRDLLRDYTSVNGEFKITNPPITGWANYQQKSAEYIGVWAGVNNALNDFGDRGGLREASLARGSVLQLAPESSEFMIYRDADDRSLSLFDMTKDAEPGAQGSEAKESNQMDTATQAEADVLSGAQ
jgi:hypothetical protein